jgi:1-phosphofructokinase family hexose kinase
VIISVTPNPALDVTYAAPALRPGEVHRVTEVTVRPGGKGVNVARVLQALDVPVMATGLSGGPGGRQLEAELASCDLRTAFVQALADVRRTTVVHGSDGVTTSFWEPGHPAGDPAAAAEDLLARVGALLPEAGAVVISGSVPPNVDAALPARLASAAAACGVPAVVDADGEPLRHAAAGRAAVLMPNREELARLDGRWPATVADAAVAAGRLCARGVPAVVVTLGAEGMLARTTAHAWIARPVAAVEGNPTGAGDAAAAAVAVGLAGPAPVDWPAVLKDAAALSAAAVRRPVAGEVDLDAYRGWRTEVQVETIPAEEK